MLELVMVTCSLLPVGWGGICRVSTPDCPAVENPVAESSRACELICDELNVEYGERNSERASWTPVHPVGSGDTTVNLADTVSPGNTLFVRFPTKCVPVIGSTILK